MSYLSRNRSSGFQARSLGRRTSTTDYRRTTGAPTTFNRRHEFTSDHGTMTTSGEYETIIFAKYKRDFTLPDDDPTPTASNNYQTPNIQQGGMVNSFQARVMMRHVALNPAFYDIYEVVCSFYDSLITDTIKDVLCPIQMTTDMPGSLDNRGEVTFKSPHITFTDNNLKNSQLLQHIIHHRIRVPFGQKDATATPTTLEFNRIPAKCRRSQIGMFYGLIIHNPSDLNGSATPNLQISSEIAFNESPTTQKMPWDG